MARARRVDVATVRLWDRDVGAVAWNAGRGLGEFEYDPAFIRQGLEIAPLMLPLREGVASFPALNRDTFHGLPGLLADALPDRFGNRIIDAWLARQGRSAGDFTPVERLCYMGVRGMGALEFKPAIGPRAVKAVPIEVAELTALVAEIFRHRTRWVVNLTGRRGLPHQGPGRDPGSRHRRGLRLGGRGKELRRGPPPHQDHRRHASPRTAWTIGSRPDRSPPQLSPRRRARAAVRFGSPAGG